ncbi:MAG: hypothetical protein WC510_07825 [Candidatus Omnitrophota bacterium]
MNKGITEEEFRIYLSDKERQWEARCRRCGACCGALGDDPCSHLKEEAQGRYYCDVYDSRLRLHKTKGGREFRCVPLRDILHQSWNGDYRCAYKNP